MESRSDREICLPCSLERVRRKEKIKYMWWSYDGCCPSGSCSNIDSLFCFDTLVEILVKSNNLQNSKGCREAYFTT